MESVRWGATTSEGRRAVVVSLTLVDMMWFELRSREGECRMGAVWIIGTAASVFVPSVRVVTSPAPFQAGHRSVSFDPFLPERHALDYAHTRLETPQTLD